MTKQIVSLVAAAGLVLACPSTGAAQSAATPPDAGQQKAVQTTASDEGWKVSAYPLLVWLPIVGMNVGVPPSDNPGEGVPGGGGGSTDSTIDGAFFFGLSVAKGPWRIDGDGIWAAVGAERLERPHMTVDMDLIYGHVSGGRKIYKDLYLTAGFRRVALSFDIKIADYPNVPWKPGVWDPLIGMGWHSTIGSHLKLDATLEGGGFGVGADADIGGSIRMDWQPLKHVGLTAGYGGLYLRLSETVAGKTFTAKELLHGPIFGLGIYF